MISDNNIFNDEYFKNKYPQFFILKDNDSEHNRRQKTEKHKKILSLLHLAAACPRSDGIYSHDDELWLNSGGKSNRPAKDTILGQLIRKYTYYAESNKVYVLGLKEVLIELSDGEWFYESLVERSIEKLINASNNSYARKDLNYIYDMRLRSYVKINSPSYKPGFKEKLNPNWFVSEERSKIKKSNDKEYLLSLPEKPKKGDKDRVKLNYYTNKSQGGYDHDFRIKLEKSKPHWFSDELSVEDMKDLLLSKAKNGVLRKYLSEKEIRLLNSYCKSDKQFEKNITHIAPKWRRKSMVDEKINKFREFAREGKILNDNEKEDLRKFIQRSSRSFRPGLKEELTKILGVKAITWFQFTVALDALSYDKFKIEIKKHKIMTCAQYIQARKNVLDKNIFVSTPWDYYDEWTNSWDAFGVIDEVLEFLREISNQLKKLPSFLQQTIAYALIQDKNFPEKIKSFVLESSINLSKTKDKTKYENKIRDELNEIAPTINKDDELDKEISVIPEDESSDEPEKELPIEEEIAQNIKAADTYVEMSLGSKTNPHEPDEISIEGIIASTLGYLWNQYINGNSEQILHEITKQHSNFTKEVCRRFLAEYQKILTLLFQTNKNSIKK